MQVNNKDLLWYRAGKGKKHIKTYEIFQQILNFIQSSEEWNIYSINPFKKAKSIDYQQGIYIWLPIFLTIHHLFIQSQSEKMKQDNLIFFNQQEDEYTSFIQSYKSDISLYSSLLPLDSCIKDPSSFHIFQTFIEPYCFINFNTLKTSHIKNKQAYLTTYHFIINHKWLLDHLSYTSLIQYIISTPTLSLPSFKHVNYSHLKHVNYPVLCQQPYPHSFIYAICQQHEIIYIGQSHRPNYARLKEHIQCAQGKKTYHSTKALLYQNMRKAPYYFRILYEGSINQTQLDAMQLGFITYFQPIYNIEGRDKAFNFVCGKNEDVYEGKVIKVEDL